MLIQDQGCFAAQTYTAEGCLSAAPVITLNQPTQSQTFLLCMFSCRPAIHIVNVNITWVFL